MRPQAEGAVEAVSEEPLETEGLLEGLRGVLAPIPVAEMVRVSEDAVPGAASEASLARAQLLQGLLTRPAEVSRPEARKRGIDAVQRIERWLVAIVLVAVVVGTLVVPGVPVLVEPARFDSVDRLHAVVQGVSAGDTVLVAFEYGPTEANELDMVAGPIMRHLHDQGAVFSVVTTQAMGLAAAEALQGEIASQTQVTLMYGSTSYLPGGAAGIAQLLANTDTQPARILVLAAQPAPLRWWIEQTKAQYSGASPPIVAGVSAALESVTSPYLDIGAGQLDGAVIGLSGAAAYEAHRGVEGEATRRLNALAAGQVAVVVLISIGAVLHAFGPHRRGKW